MLSASCRWFSIRRAIGARSPPSAHSESRHHNDIWSLPLKGLEPPFSRTRSADGKMAPAIQGKLVRGLQGTESKNSKYQVLYILLILAPIRTGIPRLS